MPITLPPLPVGTDTANAGRIKWNAAITDIVNYLNSEVDTSGMAKLAGGNTFTGNQIINGQLTVDTNIRLRMLSGDDAIVHLSSATGYMALAGGSGSGSSVGGNVLLYGQNHGSSANNVIIRSGTNIVGTFTATGTTLANNVTISGSLTASGVVTEPTGGLGYQIHPALDNSSLYVSGGNASNSGANFFLTGSTHASIPNRGVLRAGSSDVLVWGASDILINNNLRIQNNIYLNSNNHLLSNSNSGQMSIAGGTSSTSGGRIRLFGATHPSVPDTGWLNAGSSTPLTWNQTGVEISGELNLNGQTILEPFYINPQGDGDYYITFSKPMTLDFPNVVRDGTGTVAYARRPGSGGFTTVTDATAFDVGDTLRVTVTDFSGYLTLTVPRTE